MMEGVLFSPLVVWFFGLVQQHSSLPPQPFRPPVGAKGNEEKEQNFHLFPLYPSFPGSSVLIPEKNFVLFSSSLFLLFLCTIFSGPSSDFYAQGGRREFEKMGFPPFLPSYQYEICGGTSYFLQRGQQKKQNPIPGPFPVKNLGLFPGPPPLFCLSVCETLRSFSSVYVYPSHICN